MTVIDGVNHDTPWTVVEAWRPFAGAGRVSEKLTSDIAKKARALDDELHRRRQYVGTVEDEGAEAERTIAAAEAKVRSEVERDAAECGDGTSVIKATAESHTARAALDPEVWRSRLKAARERVEPAQRELTEYLDEHCFELAFELQAHANRVYTSRKTALAKITELYERTVAPLEREHDEITSTLSTLLGRTEPFTERAIPKGQYDEVPFPSPADFEAHRALNEPAPRPIEED